MKINYRINFQNSHVRLRCCMHPATDMLAYTLCLIYFIKFYKILNLIKFYHNVYGA